jgi:glucose/arabinose dehydrogenase
MQLKKHIRKMFFILMIFGGVLSTFQMVVKTGNASQMDITWPDIEVVPLVSGFTLPVHLTNADDNSDRLFVVERAGRIKIVQDGGVFVTPFLDIQDRVQSNGNEEGLLSVAFPPDFATEKHFYVYYTNANGDNQVSRFYVMENDPDLANPISEELIIYFDHPTYSNHNGGQIAFGADGYLYIATGDGGGGGDPDENGQDPASLLGKILRIDVEWTWPPPAGPYFVYLPMVVSEGVQSPLAYRIPPDNPFVGEAGYRGEIWALGLRNPWRFSFDRSTGDLYIGDVGQSSWEEIDFQVASSPGGENYGWNEMEGSHCYLAGCETSGMTLPVFEYPTHVDGSCSVTGGYVYRGVNYPNLQGFYLFADYCNGRITGLINDGGIWQSQLLLDTNLNISSFGEGEDGELYFVELNSGEIFQIIAQTP